MPAIFNGPAVFIETADRDASEHDGSAVIATQLGSYLAERPPF
ncbi:MAG TPA: hypothetical protein VGL79_05075 [Solirubrobacteraceae bacterium]